MMPANPAPIHTTLIRRYSSTEKSGLVDCRVDVGMNAEKVQRQGVDVAEQEYQFSVH
jgi:hypothetical protein